METWGSKCGIMWLEDGAVGCYFYRLLMTSKIKYTCSDSWSNKIVLG